MAEMTLTAKEIATRVYGDWQQENRFRKIMRREEVEELGNYVGRGIIVKEAAHPFLCEVLESDIIPVCREILCE